MKLVWTLAIVACLGLGAACSKKGTPERAPQQGDDPSADEIRPLADDDFDDPDPRDEPEPEGHDDLDDDEELAEGADEAAPAPEEVGVPDPADEPDDDPEEVE